MQKTFGLIIMIIAFLPLFFMKTSADDFSVIGPQQSTTGPELPPGVSPARHDDVTLDRDDKLMTGVPGYLWRHGCGPTAVGMVIGYYDGHGFPDLIPGDASTQTWEVNQAIASQGNAGNPQHYEDYSLPIDNGQPTPIPDKSEPPAGDEHASNCIADFMHTSWSAEWNYYGWSWSSDIGPAFFDYVEYAAPEYEQTYSNFYYNSGTWDLVKTEIDNDRPLVFLVDTNGDGSTDHFITVIGYRDTQGYNEYGCLDTWSPPDQVRWCRFRGMAQGNAWGIYGGTKFHLSSSQPTATPTATLVPTPLPTINAWHGPAWHEACQYNAPMRDPVSPSMPEQPVCIYGGVVMGGASGFTLHYRVDHGAWMDHDFIWTCNDQHNDYWWTYCDQGGSSWIPHAEPGSAVEYYIEVWNPGNAVTFLYNEESPSRTVDELIARNEPYRFRYPETTQTPAPSPSPAPTTTPSITPQLLNVWHIPNNQEPFSVTMRNPLDVTDDTETVHIYCGGYPSGTIWSGMLHYRKVGETSWNSSEFNFDSQYGLNEYWMASFSLIENDYDNNDVIEYYMEINGEPTTYGTTYIYGNDAECYVSAFEEEAQADPFSFIIMPGHSIPAFSTAGVLILILFGSAFLMIRRKNQEMSVI